MPACVNWQGHPAAVDGARVCVPLPGHTSRAAFPRPTGSFGPLLKDSRETERGKETEKEREAEGQRDTDGAKCAAGRGVL